MKFLDINGVKTLWGKTNGTVLTVHIDDQRIATAENRETAIIFLYDEINSCITYNTIENLNNNKINTILLVNNVNKIVAKLIILDYMLEENEEAYICAFITLRSTIYNSLDTFYGDFIIGGDTFSFYPIYAIDGAIER